VSLVVFVPAPKARTCQPSCRRIALRLAQGDPELAEGSSPASWMRPKAASRRRRR